MLEIKECLGVKVATTKENKVYTTITYSQAFGDQPEGTVTVGLNVGVINTTKSVAIKPGDHFRALYDIGQFWNSDKHVMESRPVLAEIEVLKQ